jgi:hypothetical protein
MLALLIIILFGELSCLDFNYSFIDEKHYNSYGIFSKEIFSELEDFGYKNLTSVEDSFFIYLSKGNSNYSINDGYMLEFNQFEGEKKIMSPKHLRFSFIINLFNYTILTKSFELCNIRLTNSTLKQLQSSSNITLKTSNSDPLFFRIRTNQSVTINDQSYYLANSTYNYNSGLIHIDAFLNWNDSTVLVLYNKNVIDQRLSVEDHWVNFYHNDLDKSNTIPNKIIIYNFFPNSSCLIKNIELCEDFCDEDSRQLFLNVTHNKSSYLNSLDTFLFILITVLVL